MTQFCKDWQMRTAPTIGVDLWIAKSQKADKEADMIQTLQDYVDFEGLCVTVTETDYVYTNGKEPGWRIGLRNYPRFQSSVDVLLIHAVHIGRLMAKAGDQGSYMVEEHGGTTYWYTRRKGDR